LVERLLAELAADNSKNPAASEKITIAFGTLF